MKYLGIEFPLQNMPELDPEFIPLGPWMKAYLAGASKPISIAVERDKGKITVRHAKIYGTPEMAQADYRFVERYVKFLLWSIGGFRVYILGASEIARRLAEEYVYFENGEGQNGKRWFDVQFMSDVFENGFEIVDCQDPAAFPQENDASVSVGGHMEGCRIGFDAGGSDRKVSAVIDGRTVYSEEVVWHPKTQADPQYHYDEIVSAFKTAASKMPRVDGIGVSSAGVFIGNAPMVSSLFIKVPREKEVRKLVHTIFDRAAAAIGDGNVPIVVANDGDVTALAGAMGLADRVQMPGYITGIRNWIWASDICVSSSWSEGLPFHVMESMSCGVPVLLSDVKGNADLVRDGAAGLLYPAGSHEGFREAAAKLLDAPDGRAAMTEAARKSISRFDLKTVMPRVMDWYR